MHIEDIWKIYSTYLHVTSWKLCILDTLVYLCISMCVCISIIFNIYIVILNIYIMFSYMWHTPDQPFTELGAIYSGTTYFSRYLYLAGLVSAHLPCLLCLLQSNFSEEAMAHCSHCSCFFSQNAIVSSTLPPTASKGSKAMSSEGQESSGQGFPSAPPCVPSKTTGISCRYPVAMKAFSRYVMLVEY